MILGYSVYEIAALFFIYGFLGWCMEVVFRGLSEGRFINSGFLNGPVCPIYGVGGAVVAVCLTPISDDIPILFAGSVVLTSFLELVTGFALDKIFHARWWDYTDKKLNLGGYICLQFSICWGLVCIVLMKVIHPPIIQLVRTLPFALGMTLIIVMGAAFAADVVVTVITINHLTNRVRIMEEIAEKIRAVSDGIGGKVYDGAKLVKEKGEEIIESENAQELRKKYNENMDELKKRYAAMAEESHVLQRRILKAFPRLRSHAYNTQLDKLREKLKRVRSGE